MVKSEAERPVYEILEVAVVHSVPRAAWSSEQQVLCTCLQTKLQKGSGRLLPESFCSSSQSRS